MKTYHSNLSCANCRIYLAEQKTCQLMQQMMAGKIEPTDFCSHHMSEANKCDSCKRGVLEPIFVIFDENHIGTYCENCYRAIS